MSTPALTSAEVLAHLRNCHKPTGYHVVDRDRLTCFRDGQRFTFKINDHERDFAKAKAKALKSLHSGA
jgi:hypothetical protein